MYVSKLLLQQQNLTENINDFYIDTKLNFDDEKHRKDLSNANTDVVQEVESNENK